MQRDGHKGHRCLVVCSELCSASAVFTKCTRLRCPAWYWSSEVMSNCMSFPQYAAIIFILLLRPAMKGRSWVQSNLVVLQSWYVQRHASAVTTAAKSACTAFQHASTVCGSAGPMPAHDQLCNVTKSHLGNNTASRKRVNTNMDPHNTAGYASETRFLTV